MKVDKAQAMKAIESFCQDTDSNTVLRVKSRGIFNRTYSLAVVDKAKKMNLLQKFLSLFGASAFNLKNVVSIIREVDRVNSEDVSQTCAHRVFEQIIQKTPRDKITQKQDALIKLFDRCYDTDQWRVVVKGKPYSLVADPTTGTNPNRSSLTELVGESAKTRGPEYHKAVRELGGLVNILIDAWPAEYKSDDVKETTAEDVITKVKNGLLSERIRPVFKEMIACQLKIGEESGSVNEREQRAIGALLCGRKCFRGFFKTIPERLHDGFSDIPSVVKKFEDPAFQQQILDLLR